MKPFNYYSGSLVTPFGKYLALPNLPDNLSRFHHKPSFSPIFTTQLFSNGGEN